MADPQRIAFIGLGNMGLPMAANLTKAGHALTTFDLSAQACARAREQGLPVAASAQEAVNGAQVVISMLPASRHVEGLYLGEQGLLRALPAGTLVIDCSTIAPASAQKVAQAAAAGGLAMIDAPVSGGVAGAAAGTLTFIVGGEQFDAVGLGQLARQGAAGVGTERAHQAGGGAGARGGDGLVEALAAGAGRIAAGNGGAGRGQGLAAPDVVDVERTDDGDRIHGGALLRVMRMRAARLSRNG